jgi:hypothetical protein
MRQPAKNPEISQKMLGKVTCPDKIPAGDVPP